MRFSVHSYKVYKFSKMRLTIRTWGGIIHITANVQAPDTGADVEKKVK